MLKRCLLLVLAILLNSCATNAQDAPSDEPVFDPPTLHCIGARWFVSEADHPHAAVCVEYRRSGEEAWTAAMPLRRVEVAALQENKPDEGVSLYAGSIFDLTPDTDYDVRMTLRDANGREIISTKRLRTWAEPIAPAPKRTIHVVPGDGGGAGTEDDPYKGFVSALDAAKPGDLMLLHAGTYSAGPVLINKSGTPDSPIVWRAAGDGETIIDAASDKAAMTTETASHIFIEGLTFTNASWALVLHGSNFVTVRRCTFRNVACGITADYKQERIFIADCTMIGPRTWPPDKERKVEDRGIQLSGVGHVVAYNRISGFRDGVDTRPRMPVRGIDIHNNDISECTDDGIELDYSESNCRAYRNRITNAMMGISFQPSRGGPNYAVRNVMLNIGHETFKLHLTPVAPGHMTSGGVMLNNTIVKNGPAFRVWSDEGPARYFYARNNLYITRGAFSAIEITCPMEHADLDYDLYANDQPLKFFASMNRTRYNTIEDFREKDGQEKHGIIMTGTEGILASGIRPPADSKEKLPVEKNDLRLAEGSPAIDKGEKIPNVTDGFKGTAPDIGAIEFGEPLPHYGPRPEAK